MASYNIKGGDHREYGPVSADELRRWIADGRLNAQSPARTADAAEWKVLGDFSEFADALRLQPASPPVSVAPPIQPSEWTEQILARDTELGLAECLRNGFSFLAANAAFVIPAVFITWLLKLVLVFFPFTFGILHLLLSGVVMGGLYLACLRRMRGEAATVGNVFDGFRQSFVQLMLAGAITSVLTQIGFLFCVLPGFYLLVGWAFAVPLVADKRLEFWSAMELSRKVVTRVWFPMFLLLAVVFLPFIILQIVAGFEMFGYVLASLREADFDLARWLPKLPELVTRSVIWVVGIQAAALFCQFFAVGALMRAYENLFGARQA